jgi:hypothetical protein
MFQEKEWRRRSQSRENHRRGRADARRRGRTARRQHAGPLRRGHPAANCRPTRGCPTPSWRAHRPVGRAHLAARAWLEEQGYITGYRAEIDRRKIGLGVLAFVRVDAERNNADATRALEDAIRALPEVVACHYISGAGTFELQVVATDLDASNVGDVHTSFSLGEVKAAASLPLQHLLT